MVKKVLIIALNEKWTGISRLPYGLDRAGFEVHALCPKNSFLSKTKFLKSSILYPTLTYSRSKFVYAWMVISIYYFNPDLIVPGDEDTILALQRLTKFFEKLPFFKKISNLINFSLPSKSSDSILLSKSNFQGKCQEWGLRTPKNFVLNKGEDVFEMAAQIGFPIVLKHDSGYGGSGVFILNNSEELKKHVLLKKDLSFFDKMREFIKNFFFVSIFNGENRISLQQYIEGDVGQSPFCAYKGIVFGFNPMIRLHTYPGKTGPAAVSRGYENVDIEFFVKKIVKELDYTGFGSVEYIIEKNTGKLFIIELNPRPTPTVHISSEVVPNDLCEMFYNGINSLPVECNKFKPYTLAMFPGEKKRDPMSIFLKESYHDIPLNDPDLLKAIESN